MLYVVDITREIKCTTDLELIVLQEKVSISWVEYEEQEEAKE